MLIAPTCFSASVALWSKQMLAACTATSICSSSMSLATTHCVRSDPEAFAQTSSIANRGSGDARPGSVVFGPTGHLRLLGVGVAPGPQRTAAGAAQTQKTSLRVSQSPSRNARSSCNDDFSKWPMITWRTSSWHTRAMVANDEQPCSDHVADLTSDGDS